MSTITLSKPLISTEALQGVLYDERVIVVYSRSIHGNLGGAYTDFLKAHIPRSIFMDVDTELADRSDPRRGRHPLPTPEAFIGALSARGIGPEHWVVVYDDSNGSQAARLWWMLRWIQHEAVSLLDGGLLKWQAEQRDVESGSERKLPPPRTTFAVATNDSMIATIAEVERAEFGGSILLDARSAERFAGNNETIDWRAGHIPGALSSPFAVNLHGMPPTYKSAGELQQRFAAAGITQSKNIICYCGSGVTACHTLLALELAGIAGAKLYPGSWSEWIETHELR